MLGRYIFAGFTCSRELTYRMMYTLRSISLHYILCFILLHCRVLQVRYLLERKDRRGRSVLSIAARGGSGELFQQALKVLEEVYTDDQVRAVYIFGVDILKTEGLWEVCHPILEFFKQLKSYFNLAHKPHNKSMFRLLRVD